MIGWRLQLARFGDAACAARAMGGERTAAMRIQAIERGRQARDEAQRRKNGATLSGAGGWPSLLTVFASSAT